MSEGTGAHDRRSLLRWGAAATGAAAISSLRGRAKAQDASPVAGIDRDISTMFVQAFHDGSWVPGASEDMYTLTLHGGLASTIYFSDRPDRVYGVTPTEDFLLTIGFSPQNPPNAALVVDVDGVRDILVIELMNPMYDERAQVLTYDAKVLGAYEEGDLGYLAVQQEDLILAEQFGAGALFIDDCSDVWEYCYRGEQRLEQTGQFWGQCYHYPACRNCRDYKLECNQTWPSLCEGKCGWGAPRGHDADLL